MPVTTVWKILRKRLELRRYRLQLLQALKPTDYGLPPNSQTTCKVWNELVKRLDVCRVTNGAHSEYL
ncbi:hypothetical protein TNCV_2792681 [Trichonephila clavipes]|nr:hypothetical protein TNCV_2792681 [Trichonephila clavipes]